MCACWGCMCGTRQHAYMRERPYKVIGIVSAGLGTPTSPQHGPGNALYPEMNAEAAAVGGHGEEHALEHARVASDVHSRVSSDVPGLGHCSPAAVAPSPCSRPPCPSLRIVPAALHGLAHVHIRTHRLTTCLRTHADRTARGVRGDWAHEHGVASLPTHTPDLVSQLCGVRLRKPRTWIGTGRGGKSTRLAALHVRALIPGSEHRCCQRRGC